MHFYPNMFSTKDYKVITLPTDERLSQYEINAINRICEGLESVFTDSNKTICSDCPNEREKYYLTPQHRPYKGCCRSCADSNGWFWSGVRYGDRQRPRLVRDRQQQIKDVKALFDFDSEHGFFLPKVGCKLPRARRSYTCLSYTCNHIKVDLKVVTGLVDGLTAIREHHNIIA